MIRFGAIALFSLFAATAEAATAIKFGKLWDGHRVVPNAVVVVDNGRIVSVAANGAVPAGAQVVDLADVVRASLLRHRDDVHGRLAV